MNIKKLTANDFNVGTRYSILGKKNTTGEAQDIINAEFTGITRSLKTLYFKDNEGNELNVVITEKEIEDGFNVIEHDAIENEYFILGNCDFIIIDFETKEEAKQYLQDKEEILYTLNGGQDKDTIEVKSGKEVADIVSEIFFVNNNGFELKWIEKTEDLQPYVKRFYE